MAPVAIRACAAVLIGGVLASCAARRNSDVSSGAQLGGVPEKIRPPLQNEFEKCVLRAEDAGNRSLSGKVRVELLIRKTGNVYGAFVWSEGGVDDRKFERCLTSYAPLWVFPPVPVDYLRAFTVTFIASGTDVSQNMHSSQGLTGSGRASVMMPRYDDLPEPSPLNVKAAQETLDLADWVTGAERAYAETVVKLYPQAIEHARLALQQNPSDAIALRALAQALAESGGDLVEARRAAERLVAIDPASIQGHEVMLRVCLAAQDDKCAFDSWNHARKAPDLQPRSRLIADLQGPTQLAVERLKSAAQRPRAVAAAPDATTGSPGDAAAVPQQPADPCAQEKSDEAQALCVVKRCLDAGTLDYAKELSSQNGLPYAAKDWRAKRVAAGKLLVTRPIEPVPAKPGDPQPEAARHDALWLVNLGDQLVMRPTNTEARQITVRHNRCTARVVQGQ